MARTPKDEDQSPERIRASVKAFQAPKLSLGHLDAEAAAILISAAADIALIVDEAGVIRDLAFSTDELAKLLEGATTWLGKPWIETVAADSRPKVEALLQGAIAGTPPRWRHVNQLTASSASHPILFSAVRIGKLGRAVAFGRDLMPISHLQQRLIDAQASMERDFAKLRHAETRYRLLFQLDPEPVLIVDEAGRKVLDANPAATQLVELAAASPLGFLGIFAPASHDPIRLLLAGVRATGRSDDVRVQLEADGHEAALQASVFRQDGAPCFLLRLAVPLADANAILLPKPKAKLLKLVENAPDAFVVTAHDGRIVTVNGAFLDLAQLHTEEQARSEPIDRWLGRSGVDFEVLAGALRRTGPVKLFATTFRGEYGSTTDVEISAVSVMNGGTPCYGFAIREVAARPVATAPRNGQPATRSVEQLTELVGRVPLKDLVREATDVIERLAIEAALQLTNDNRASAAEMLGLSRQSLYVKLRRYGLGDQPDAPEAEG